MTGDGTNFIFLTCKRESTPLLKDEMKLRFPEARFSYSRPSFLTYKLPGAEESESAEALFVPAFFPDPRTLFICASDRGAPSCRST